VKQTAAAATCSLALASFGAGHFSTEVPMARPDTTVVSRRNDHDTLFPVDGPDRDAPTVTESGALGGFWHPNYWAKGFWAQGFWAASSPAV
jgi:hypothetical protein